MIDYDDYDSIECCISIDPKGVNDENSSVVKIRTYKDRISYSMASMRYKAEAYSKDKYEQCRLLGSAKLAGYMFINSLRGEKGDMPEKNNDWMLWVYDRAYTFDFCQEFDREDLCYRRLQKMICFRVSNLVYESEMRERWQAKFEEGRKDPYADYSASHPAKTPMSNVELSK